MHLSRASSPHWQASTRPATTVADPCICGPGGCLPHYQGFAININRQCTGTASSGGSKAQNLSASGGLLWPLTL